MSGLGCLRRRVLRLCGCPPTQPAAFPAAVRGRLGGPRALSNTLEQDRLACAVTDAWRAVPDGAPLVPDVPSGGHVALQAVGRKPGSGGASCVRMFGPSPSSPHRRWSSPRLLLARSESRTRSRETPEAYQRDWTGLGWSPRTASRQRTRSTLRHSYGISRAILDGSSPPANPASSSGLGLAGSLSVWPLDDDIRQSRFNAQLPGHGGDRLNDVFKAGSHLGSTLVHVGGSFATYTIGRLVGKPNVAELGRDLIRAQLVTGGVTRLLKHTVRRTRPASSGSSRTSFPSGHASGTFASATVLSRHYGWKVGVPAFALASYVGASRVVDNSHFLSDVVFGAALGMTAGRAVTFERGATRLQVSPMAVPRGIGVLVSLN